MVCVVGGGVACDVLDGCGVAVANDGGVLSVVSICGVRINVPCVLGNVSAAGTRTLDATVSGGGVSWVTAGDGFCTVVGVDVVAGDVVKVDVVVVVVVVVVDGDGGDCVARDDGGDVELKKINVVAVRDVFVNGDSGCVALSDVFVVFRGCGNSSDVGGVSCLIVWS